MPRTLSPKRRGPVETVEAKGVQIPIYSAPYRNTEGFMLAYYAEGVRKRERASSLEIARRRARELIEDLTSGAAHVTAFSPKETAAINEAVEILRPVGVPLTEVARQYAEALRQLNGTGSLQEAVRCFLTHRKKAQLPAITVPDLVARVLEDFRDKGKSRRYQLDMQARLNRAAKHFTGNLVDVRAEQIDSWLSSLREASGRTRNNYRAALITLFAFARQKGYLPRGQETEAEFATRYSGKGGEIGIYSPDQLTTLLSEVSPRFVPFVAIGAFAGLRTSEIVRLEWPEIRFDQGVIEIKAAKAKTASRRLVPILPVLLEWLTPLRREAGKVLLGVLDEFAQATQFRKAVAAIQDGEGNPKLRIVPNGLRHSFITYRLAALKSAAEVALEAGNSPRMIFEHYRELATATQAADWFAVRPTPERSRQLAQWTASLMAEPALPVAAEAPKKAARRKSRRNGLVPRM